MDNPWSICFEVNGEESQYDSSSAYSLKIQRFQWFHYLKFDTYNPSFHFTWICIPCIIDLSITRIYTSKYHNPYFVRKLHLKFIVKILIFRFQKYVFKRRAKRKCLFGYVPYEANEYWAPREENDAGFTCVSWLFRKAKIGTWLRRSLSRNNHR